MAGLTPFDPQEQKPANPEEQTDLAPPPAWSPPAPGPGAGTPLVPGPPASVGEPVPDYTINRYGRMVALTVGGVVLVIVLGLLLVLFTHLFR